MTISKLRRDLYRGARILGDIQAAEKGPNAYARRVVRKRIYRAGNGGIAKACKTLGLWR